MSSNGNWDAFILKLSLPIGVGTLDLKDNLELNVFPNPTSGIITIDLGVVKQDIKATLTNGLGQVILTKNYTSTSFINLNIEAPRGIYFLQLESDREVINKKIIKE